ncbi:MAG TPA: M48 family metallopeptidase [Victivallales bacterium]|nr:M48 family metallopeptidase [Victivallales bacterium]
MNLVLSIIFLIFIVFNLFEFYLEYLNCKQLKKMGEKVPEGFESLIDKEKLSNINKYTLEKTKFGVINKIYSLVLIVLFMFLGLMNVYNSIIFSFNLSYYWNGIIYLFVLMFLFTVLEIPFDLHSTFKIEKKYGFNTMSAKLWIVDFVKSLVVSFILISVLIFASFAIIKYIEFWWFWVWLMFFIFTISMMYISPYVLEPLFNKFKPLEDQELSDQLTSTMQKVGIKISKILTMDASKRTKHSNAYFSGIGRVKRIVLFDTLLENMNKDEITAVIAHEAGHWKKKHILKRIISIECIVLVALIIAYLLIQNNFILAYFNINAVDHYSYLFLLPCSFIILFFLFSIVMFPFKPIMNYRSRVHEKQADAYVVKLTGSSKNLVSALRKLSADNLSNLYPHHWYSLFHYSHPPVMERIDYLNSLDK